MTEVRGLFSDNSHLEGVAFWPIDREELNSANGHSSSEKDPSPAESSDEASPSPGIFRQPCGRLRERGPRWSP